MAHKQPGLATLVWQREHLYELSITLDYSFLAMPYGRRSYRRTARRYIARRPTDRSTRTLLAQARARLILNGGGAQGSPASQALLPLKRNVETQQKIGVSTLQILAAIAQRLGVGEQQPAGQQGAHTQQEQSKVEQQQQSSDQAEPTTQSEDCSDYSEEEDTCKEATGTGAIECRK